MVSEGRITEIFCIVDDFCKEFNQTVEKHSIDHDCTKKRRNRTFKLSDSEVITILIRFHLYNARCLKCFYINYVCRYMKEYFLQEVSYNCFVEL